MWAIISLTELIHFRSKEMSGKLFSEKLTLVQKDEFKEKKSIPANAFSKKDSLQMMTIAEHPKVEEGKLQEIFVVETGCRIATCRMQHTTNVIH